MEVEDPEAACADDDLHTAVKMAQAELTKADAENVDLTCGVVSRRLGSGGRRLAGSIEFSYRIAVASAEAASAMADKISNHPPEDFAALIQSKLPEGSSYDIKVLSLSATAIMVTVTTTATTTEGEELDDSHARAPAALGSFAMALTAASLMVVQ